MKKTRKNEKGITLVALTVTIIVLLIIGGVTVVGLKGDNGILNTAGYTKLLSELSEYKEEVELFKENKEAENKKFNGESLTAGKDTINYNTKKEDETGNIKTVVTDISDKYFSNLEIIKGELLLKTKDKQLIKAAKQVGIQINPYDITDEGELLSSNGNLLLLDNEGTLTLPDSVKKIGSGAFSGVEGLRKIIIPSSVIEIEDTAFSNNKTLETVVIQGNLTSIGNLAFDGANKLSQINLPDTITYIGTRAFRGTNLTEVSIPKSLKYLNLGVFDHTKLTEVELKEGIIEIGEEVFYGVPLQKINFPSTLIKINGTSFANCDKLSQIDLSKNTNFVYESGILMNSERTEIKFISDPIAKASSTFKIPEGIIEFTTSISNYTNIIKIIIPSTLQNVQAINLPSSIKEIEVVSGNNYLACENNLLYTKSDNKLLCCCSKESNIVITNNIENIMSYAFNMCPNAISITLPDTVKYIQDGGFEWLANLKTINIGKNVCDINPLFIRMYFGKTINISNDNPYYVIENNILYKKENGKVVSLIRAIGTISGTAEIRNDITKIGDYAFYAQKGLNQIVIPTSVKELGISFSYCPNLKKIEIPKSVTKINNYCFGDATNNLEEIIIHNKENSIPDAPWGAAKGMKVVKWET